MAAEEVEVTVAEEEEVSIIRANPVPNRNRVGVHEVLFRLTPLPVVGRPSGPTGRVEGDLQRDYSLYQAKGQA